VDGTHRSRVSRRETSKINARQRGNVPTGIVGTIESGQNLRNPSRSVKQSPGDNA
jgi:hypothetical protein